MRWIFRISGALLVAALLLLGGLLLLPGEKIAQVVLNQIEAATGREVTLEGDVSVSFYPVLGVRTGAMSIANAAWSDKGPMLKAEALNIGVETMPLLSGRIRIKALELTRPDLLLERDRNGRGNWEIDFGTASGDGRQFALALDHVELRGGRVRYLDQTDGSRQEFSGLDAVLEAPDLAGPARLELALEPAGERVVLSAGVAGILAFVSGEPVAVTADVTAGGGTLNFIGRATATGDAEGRLKADLPVTGKVLEALGMAGVNPPKGLGQAVSAEGLVVLKAGKSLALRKAEFRLDHNAFSGDLDVRFGGDRPFVTARLDAGDLDFSGLSGGGGSAGGDGWSRDPIDAGALGVLDGQARITARSVDLGTLKFAGTDITATLDRSRIVFSLTRLAGYGGAFGGEFVLNNRNGLSVGGKLNATAVELRDLLSDLAAITRLSGEGTATVSFLGVGGSLEAIMKSLKGEGQIAVDKGTISGFDLDRLMRSGDGSGGTTIFDRLDARFTMAAGNMLNDDLKMTLPGIEATGKGRVGLGARDIDYLFTPVVLKARKGKGLAIPVRISGPWAAPRITPDMKAAIDLNLAEEKKALENKVESEVREKLSEELDIEVKEGEKVEDALERKVEEELIKGLRKLLE